MGEGPLLKAGRGWVPLLATLFPLLAACNSSEPPTPQPLTPSTLGKAQALLLTQAFPYDDARKDSIAGPYVQQSRLEVPTDLSPQNKWVMFEGPVLENDVVAYRFYMDDRHRFDIYGKRVADLVMDTVGWDYHDVMDWGSDVLKVGNSLGMGSPAVVFEDSVYTFSNAKRKVVEVTEAGGERAAVRTTFEDLDIGGETVTIQEDFSLAAGTPAAHIRLRVTEGVLPKGAQLATGVVIHDTEAAQQMTDDKVAVYSWGDQSYHGDKLGMAVVADKSTGAVYLAHPLTHLMVFSEGLTEVDYDMVSGWELGVQPVRTEGEFEAVLEDVMLGR